MVCFHFNVILFLILPTVSSGILHPSAGTSVGGTTGGVTDGQGPTGAGVKAPKPFIPGAGGYPYGVPYGVPQTGPVVQPGVPTLPGAKPLKPPVTGVGAGIPLAAGSYPGGYNPYQQGYGQGGPAAAGGGAKAPKPGYGNLGAGGVPQAGGPAYPGYGYPQQFYPGGYAPAPLNPQQAKAAKYGPLQAFLGGGGGGGGGQGAYRGAVPGCLGKYCGRRK
ncbi:myosin heavy chain IB-like [Cololabis saira]|uniref:myosin heavy chain IB-like n=1 Tax=Cololabis saira TaxID=129043 RepID=UPI002AD56A92|nr:myosin heavy chain IB-like [Cololabis saira]